MDLLEAWEKSNPGDILEMSKCGVYPFHAVREGTLGQFIHKELANAIVNIRRQDWIVRLTREEFCDNFDEWNW